MVRLKEHGPFYHAAFPLMFQFLYGAIKRNAAGINFARKVRFNSSMVRLKDVTGYSNDVFTYCFNSSMVRLKVSYAPYSNAYQKVSIPLWCD